MKYFVPAIRMSLRCILLLITFGFHPDFSYAQQTKISDFALFGGNGSCPGGPGQKTPSAPGCGVIIGNGSQILGGSICSYSLVQGYNSINIAGNIYSGGTVNFSNSNIIAGRITAANSL